MIPVARIGDTVVGYCNGPNHEANREFVGVWCTGSDDVFADHIGVVRVGDTGVTDCDHVFFAATGAETVFANTIGVHRVGDTVITEGDGVGVSVTGSDTVFADDITGSMVTVLTSSDSAIDQVLAEADELDDGTPSGRAAADAAIQKHIDSGLISAADINKTAVESDRDVVPPPNIPITGDCQGYDSITSFPDSFPLTEKYSVGYVTKQVVFPHSVTANKGLTVNQIICNLKLLTVNCWTPIKARYPNAFITCSFRPGEHEKQHGDGCAMDIQFRGASKYDYYNIAKWIKDNVVFDRLLLEYKTVGTGMPWIHISFKSSPSRLVFTFLNNRKYSDGLVDLSKT